MESLGDGGPAEDGTSVRTAEDGDGAAAPAFPKLKPRSKCRPGREAPGNLTTAEAGVDEKPSSTLGPAAEEHVEILHLDLPPCRLRDEIWAGSIRLSFGPAHGGGQGWQAGYAASTPCSQIDILWP